MSLFCTIIDHSWRYNFPSLPNKRICGRCKLKEKLNLRSLEWEEKDFPDSRTNEELIEKWFR